MGALTASVLSFRSGGEATTTGCCRALRTRKRLSLPSSPSRTRCSTSAATSSGSRRRLPSEETSRSSPRRTMLRTSVSLTRSTRATSAGASIRHRTSIATPSMSIRGTSTVYSSYLLDRPVYSSHRNLLISSDCGRLPRIAVRPVTRKRMISVVNGWVVLSTKPSSQRLEMHWPTTPCSILISAAICATEPLPPSVRRRRTASRQRQNASSACP